VGRKLRPLGGLSSSEAAEVQHASPLERILAASRRKADQRFPSRRCPASNYPDLLDSYALQHLIT